MTKKVLLLALLLACTATFVFAGTVNVAVPLAKPAYQNGAPHHPAHRLDQTIYSENWESGTLNNWVGRDLTAQPATWHISSFNAYVGTNWWVGDTTAGLNGYNNDWYMALNSPAITIPVTTPRLSFWHRYKCETPGGEPTGYNGWDGMNLRISTDNGVTWTVVPGAALTPTYDRTSLYSFGFQHHEGLNIPGWAGPNTTWHLETADLTQWAGQSVKFRWAFASDPQYCTTDDRTMFGWQIDNIRVYRSGATDTVFSDDCNSVGSWTTQSVRPTGGDMWRIATDNTSPAGSHIIVCNNPSNNLYGPAMHDVLESPYIRADTLPNGTLMADVQVTGSVQGTNFPDADYWTIEVSVDSGITWCKISNPTCDPTGTSYVYTDCPTTWASFNESYSNPMDFSGLLGHVLKVRFSLETNADALYDVGPKFDGFTMDYTGGFPNDVSCYTLQVRYPNNVNRPFKVKAYFRNPGQNAENGVQGWWKVVPQNWQAFLPLMDFTVGARATRETNVTISTAGTYELRGRVNMTTDENRANDSSVVAGVVVNAATAPLEIGYDNHMLPDTFYYFPRFATGSGPMVHFTPRADSILDRVNLNNIKIQFSDQQPSDNMPVRLHIYRGGAAVPGQEIVNQLITVALTETGTATWKTVDVSSVPETRNMGLDFWVWLETTNTDATTRYPAIIGANAKPWDDIHNFQWNGTDNPTQMDYFFQMHATIADAAAAGDNTLEIPAVWELNQNYPNPFNPTTEIRYAVPRAGQMTLKVYNVLGEAVATLVNGVQDAGVHIAQFNGANLTSGVYFYRLESAGFSATRKMLLMK